MVKQSSFNFCSLVCACIRPTLWMVLGVFWFKSHPSHHETGPLSVPRREDGQALFELLNAPRLGIVFTNSFPREIMMDNALMNGSGVALGDMDADGLCDLYFSNLKGSNGLFKNLGGWRFEEVTEQSGTGLPDQESTGATFADIDGDGRLDLLVTSLSGRHAVFMNQGGGRFVDRTKEAGISTDWGATSMALADVDLDGDLDLYVCNYGRLSVLKTGGKISWRMVNGRPQVTGRHANRIKIINGHFVEYGEPDRLYLNQGDGRFLPVSWTDGAFRDEDDRIMSEEEWFQSLSVSFRDINRDGWPDIYICNDGFMPDRIWMNRGDGTFKLINRLAIRQTSYSSMGVDFADIDRDGHDDFFVADMLATTHRKRMTQRLEDILGQPEGVGIIDSRPQYRRNTLHINRGDTTYYEAAFYAGLAATDWSWSVVFLDADLDGWEDLFVTNGFPIDPEDKDLEEKRKQMEVADRNWKGFQIQDYQALDTPNLVFRNLRNGRFEDTGETWGFHSRSISYGMALGDLDNDGDLDLVINALNDMPLIYRNQCSEPRLKIRLKGRSPNTQGIGARITVNGGPVVQSQEVMAGGRYMSGDDPIRVFAAGDARALLEVTVDWPGGGLSKILDVPANHSVLIHETEEAPEKPPWRTESPETSLFIDRTHLLNHTHQDAVFDDFQRQPGLGQKLSQMGPGLLWLDADADGWEDLIVGAGGGGTLSLLMNRAGRGFEPSGDRIFQAPVVRDLLGLSGEGGKDPYFLVSSSNYETGYHEGLPAVLKYFFKTRRLTPVLADIPSASGSMALADVDGDGDLDLFVGGHGMPGRYPLAADSRLLLNQGSNYQEASYSSTFFKSTGLVTACVFSDIDADGDPDLLLATDWGPVKCFLNQDGHFHEATDAVGFGPYLGRWQSVATGDFNEDGLPDVLAGNFGLNTRYSLEGTEAVQLAYGNLQIDGSLGLLEMIRDTAGVLQPTRGLESLQQVQPRIREVYQSHQAYSQADGEEIARAVFGEKFDTLKVNTLQSMVFINRGNRFEAFPLPKEAQLSPVFGMVSGDMDLDGNEDVFLAQNMFANIPNLDRYAAGTGLILLGNGEGGFEALGVAQSGVAIYGEQRGVALGDFNRDGRPDLAVSQNGAQTRLFENRNPKQGIRIALRGSNSNPNAIGASMRWVYPEGKGPRREVQAGNGYLSQNSPIQILEANRASMELEVIWPGGRKRVYPLPKNQLNWNLSQP